MSSYNRRDKFYQKAKKEGYVARSAYKLMELDKRFGILKPGRKIIDLGCAPGGWLQVGEEKKGNMIGIDLLPLQYEPSSGVCFIQGDFFDPTSQQKIITALRGKGDWILSDMSPNISGVKFRDTLASAELCEAALEFAKKVLKKGGGLVVKIFPGSELDPFRKKMKGFFQKVTPVTPEATRKSSNEIYLVAEGLIS